MRYASLHVVEETMSISSENTRRAWLAGGILAAMFCCIPGMAGAAPIESVNVSVAASEGTLSPSMEKRISASISAIGGRVLVGKEENLFRLNQEAYNKVLADIVNRVVVGYVVSDLSISYGPETDISVTLQPVGRLIEDVETAVDYGNLSPEAETLVRQDLSGIGSRMAALLTGLPVDSVGWAESVSQSAGRDILNEALPEFQANFEVEPGEHTKVRIYLIPQGAIIRKSLLTFRETTIPRLLMYRAAETTERKLSDLEGLPVAFVARHREDIAADMQKTLEEDSFVKRYEIAVKTELFAGETTELKVDALTDHWLIQTEAWLDAGRDGNKTTAFSGLLGHYVGKNDMVFGEARFYPGPMDWNVYGGFMHRFGRDYFLGYKYDLVEKSSHVIGRKKFGDRWAFRYDRDFREKENEYGISYRIHNYMSVEYVYNDEEGKWVRFIANL